MNRSWLLGIAVSVLAVSMTWWISDFRLSQFVMVISWAIPMVGLNLLTGFNGQISLGHGAFMGIGAYTVAILVRDQGMSYPLAMVIAFVICFVVGGLLGIPALRLPGTSLALITVALALAFPQIIKKYSSVTNGVGGITTPPGRQFRAPTSGFMSGLTNDQFRYLVFTLIAIVLFWLAWNLVRGRWGLAMMSVRDNPVSAASMGVNLPRTKVVTFAISAGYAGIGGAVLVMATGFVGPDNFGVAVSISILTGVVIGGLGTIAGAVIGAIFVQFMPNWAQDIPGDVPPGVVYGVVIIVVMILAPGGVMGLARRGYAWVLRKRGGSATEAAVLEDTGGFSTETEEPVHTGTVI
jgi:branched-chain amino acid transport system permease protein